MEDQVSLKLRDDVLVTGGCGFIGANLARELLDDGYKVRILDNLSRGRLEYLEGLPLEAVIGDIRDPSVVERALQGCSGLVHLAAEASVLDSVRDPLPSLQVNVAGTVGMLSAAVKYGVKRFVFASSNAAVGPHEPPIDELTPARPVSPYGASKLAGESYCLAFQGGYNLSTIALRFSNAYGPFCGHKTSVIAKLLLRILGSQPITVYGDGLQTRDFIFASDVTRAIRLALKSHHNGVLQIGTGVETSIAELISLLGEVTNTKPLIEWLPQPMGEIRRSFVTTSLATQALGFSAQVGLRDGISITYDWLRGSLAKRGILPEVGPRSRVTS